MSGWPGTLEIIASAETDTKWAMVLCRSAINSVEMSSSHLTVMFKWEHVPEYL